MKKSITSLGLAVILFGILPSISAAQSCYSPSDCPGGTCVIGRNGRGICRRGGSNSGPTFTENEGVLERELSSSSSSSSSTSIPSPNPNPQPPTPVHIPKLPPPSPASSSSASSSSSISGSPSSLDHTINEPIIVQPRPFTEEEKLEALDILEIDVESYDDLRRYAEALTSTKNIVSKITIDSKSGLTVDVDAKARLFGFIPVRFTFTTHILPDGTAEVRSPWWLFFANDELTTYETQLQVRKQKIGALLQDDPTLPGKHQSYLRMMSELFENMQ